MIDTLDSIQSSIHRKMNCHFFLVLLDHYLLHLYAGKIFEKRTFFCWLYNYIFGCIVIYNREIAVNN